MAFGEGPGVGDNVAAADDVAGVVVVINVLRGSVKDLQLICRVFSVRAQSNLGVPLVFRGGPVCTVERVVGCVRRSVLAGNNWCRSSRSKCLCIGFLWVQGIVWKSVCL